MPRAWRSSKCLHHKRNRVCIDNTLTFVHHPNQMIESLHAHQIDRILELGAWRDEGRLFEVGKDGEVGKHHEDRKENSNGHSGKRTTGREGTAGREGATGLGASSAPQPSRQNRGEALRQSYLRHLPEILQYYPSAISREVTDGLWVIVQSFPLGRDGPRFWICLFLPYSDKHDPKAFAFRKISLPRTVGPRHTNFPDASICAFSSPDDAWRPGDSPIVLLNLYAEWLICQMYFRVAGFWPGGQSGLDAVYRQAEFKPGEWCFCDSRLRYGECHFDADKNEVERLRAKGDLFDHGPRKVPSAILRFAKSRWKRVPLSSELHLHRYTGLPSRA